MKTALCLSILCAAAIHLRSAETPATAIPNRPHLFPHLEFVTGYSIANGFWNYDVTLQRTRNTGKQQSIIQYGCAYPVPKLPELVVNGINSRNLFLEKESLKKWEDKAAGSAGCEVILNFDGAKILFRVFMKKDSQLLFVRIAPEKSSIGPIRTIEFSNFACINLDKDPKKRWVNSSYAREIVTSSRTLKEYPRKGFELAPEENTLLFRDANFGKNPVYMTFQSDPVLKATVINGAYQTLKLTLKPDLSEFTYAFWCSPKKTFTNAELEALMKSAPAFFQLKEEKTK